MLLVGSYSFAQEYKAYDWKENPKIHELSASEKDNSSIGILKRHIVEYYMLDVKCQFSNVFAEWLPGC